MAAHVVINIGTAGMDLSTGAPPTTGVCPSTGQHPIPDTGSGLRNLQRRNAELEEDTRAELRRMLRRGIEAGRQQTRRRFGLSRVAPAAPTVPAVPAVPANPPEARARSIVMTIIAILAVVVLIGAGPAIIVAILTRLWL